MYDRDSYYATLPPGVGVTFVKTEFLSNVLLQWKLSIPCIIPSLLYVLLKALLPVCMQYTARDES